MIKYSTSCRKTEHFDPCLRANVGAFLTEFLPHGSQLLRFARACPTTGAGREKFRRATLPNEKSGTVFPRSAKIFLWSVQPLPYVIDVVHQLLAGGIGLGKQCVCQSALRYLRACEKLRLRRAVFDAGLQ